MTLTKDDIEELYSVECECGLSTGTFKSRSDAEEVLRAHNEHCDKHTEITPGRIPGYA